MLARRCRRGGVTGAATYARGMTEDVIAGAEELRGHVGDPVQRTLDKEIDHLDHHCADFIARSPIVMLATAGADGRCDCSPRGGPPGFVHVVDRLHLALPDYKGNRRQDSHVNVTENPHVGLLFLIPGLGETQGVHPQRGVGPLDLARRAAAGGADLPRPPRHPRPHRRSGDARAPGELSHAAVVSPQGRLSPDAAP
jgi:predicted pyridoxine 5'-phosphate oxidase superfamily flavin-nucleotide-binding protein